MFLHLPSVTENCFDRGELSRNRNRRRRRWRNSWYDSFFNFASNKNRQDALLKPAFGLHVDVTSLPTGSYSILEMVAVHSPQCRSNMIKLHQDLMQCYGCRSGDWTLHWTWMCRCTVSTLLRLAFARAESRSSQRS